ncbi:cytochrome c oxidase subunit I [Ramlibacter solisilvae]
MPEPRAAVIGDGARTRTGRLKMLLVLAVCAAPVVASYFTYYVVRPEGRRSHGELIEPQRSLPAVTAESLQGQPVSLPSLKGQWLLVSVSGGACGDNCENNLYLQRQLRESFGKDKDRVDWVWLIDDRATVRPDLQAAVAPATVLRVDAAQLSQWLAPAAGNSLHDHLYLVDPMGNWMMRFPPVRERDAASARNIKRDVERLLRASASWDTAGRPAR